MSIELLNERKELPYHIIDITAKYYGLETETFRKNLGRRITPETVYKRYVCYFLLRKYTFLSYYSISQLFNKNDHSNVKTGLNKIDDLRSYDARTITEIKELTKLVDNFKAKLLE